MNTREIALTAARTMEEKKGLNIKLLEVTEVTTLAEYFLICTGTSSTQIKTLCDAVEEAVEACGEPLLHREGHRCGTWVLLDFGSLVCHVFTDETRSFYDLERMWNDAKPVALEA